MNPALAFTASLLTTLAAAQAQQPASPYMFPAATPESVGLTSQALKDLDAAVQGYIDRGEAVGAELLVIKNRKSVWHAAHGLSDAEAKKNLEPGSIFCVRSMTKPFVGTAIQMLIDEGKLSLSDHAAKYLPAFDTDTHGGITIAHLLTHTSGLPLSSLIEIDHKSLKSVQDVAANAAKATLQSPPGAKFNYSDDGTDTLTAIIEKVSALPAETFIQQRILAPLGMADTIPVLKPEDPRRARMIPLYGGSTGSWSRIWSPQDEPLFPYFLGSQSLYSTCEDYARFLCFWADGGVVNGKPLLSKDAIARALTPANPMDYPCGFTGLRVDYAQLWMTWVNPSTTPPTPPTRVAFGHGGSDGTAAWIWPKQDLIVLYFTQSRGGLTSLTIEKDLDRLLFGGTTNPAQTAAPLLGIYWNKEKAAYTAIVERDGKPNIEIPGRFFGVIAPGKEADHWTFQLDPSIDISFQRAPDGKVLSVEMRSGDAVIAHADRLTPAADLPTPDAVITKVLAAHNTAKLDTIGAIRRTGATDMPKLKRHLSLVHLIDGPRLRLEVSIQGALAQTIVTDGTQVWNKVGQAKAERLAPALEEQTLLDRPIVVFGDWRKHFKEVTVLARTTIDDTPALIVRCIPTLGYPTAFYVSSETGTVIAQDKIGVIPGMGAVGVSIRYGDFRDAGGTQLPFKTKINYASPLLGEAQTTFETAEVGVPTDAATFARPPQSP